MPHTALKTQQILFSCLRRRSPRWLTARPGRPSDSPDLQATVDLVARTIELMRAARHLLVRCSACLSGLSPHPILPLAPSCHRETVEQLPRYIRLCHLCVFLRVMPVSGCAGNSAGVSYGISWGHTFRGADTNAARQALAYRRAGAEHYDVSDHRVIGSIMRIPATV